jgi:NAD(P)H-hydrate epimerase
MQPVLNIEDVKRVEVALTRVGVSVSELMHRAGFAAAQEVLSLPGAETVVVLAGMGNNGGDGWVAAETLKSKGMAVQVVTPVNPDDLRGDLARVVAQAAVGAGVPIIVGPSRSELEALLDKTDVVLDCMLGTGFEGAPRAPFDIWIECLNASGARVVAVDVPSGLSAQTGFAPGPCVVADMTVTMLALKPGLLADRGRDVCGSIVVAPLAEQTAQLVVEADPVAWRAELDDYLDVLVEPSAAVDKFSRGSVLVVGGSNRFPGAPIMAARAAARAGAGYVTLAVPESIAALVQTQVLEIPVVGLPCDADGIFVERAADRIERLAESNTATLVGPGMRVTPGTMSVVSALINSKAPLVIDADGLNSLAHITHGQLDEYPEMLRRSRPLVLTPHQRELARLIGQDTAPTSLVGQLEAARRIIWSNGGSELAIVAKGSATGCVGVERAILPKPGPAALATAGSGDVLGGIIASLLAQKGGNVDDLPLICALACEIHGLAGSIAAERFGSRGVMAGDIIDVLGIATDTIEEHCYYPEAVLADGE